MTDAASVTTDKDKEAQGVAKASQEFEALVVGELLKTMRKTISAGKKEGFDSQIATGMFDEELAKHIASAGAFGIAKVMSASINEHKAAENGTSMTSGIQAGSATANPADWSMPIDAAPTHFSEGQKFGADRVGHDHQGLDLAKPVGTPVHAARDGIVTGIGRDLTSSGGLQVKVTHDDGFTTKYMHLDSLNDDLQVGQKVNAGDGLGTVGNTGTSSHGAHLHFEIEQNGNHLDPQQFMKNWRRP